MNNSEVKTVHTELTDTPYGMDDKHQLVSLWQFYCFKETLIGKETLHDTARITLQTVIDDKMSIVMREWKERDFPIISNYTT